MTTLLIKNAQCLATFDDANPSKARELLHASVFVRDNLIESIGPAAELPQTADEVIDARGHLVTPGLINTHHHMFQSLTRAIPAVQDAELFSWLRGLYPIWAGLTPEMVQVSTQVAMAELLLSGCTTSSDHLYIYPNDCTLDSQIRAAADLGVRFHAARGSMSLGESQGGLPPDRVTEDEAFILRDSRRLIETYHDAGRHAMTRVVLAPCSPFSVTADLMRESAQLARAYGVRLHTHLAETIEEEAFCLETFGLRPVPYVESLGWTGDDVWHAHCVHMSQEEIGLFGRTGTGVAHCPSSNMRLASGICHVLDLRRAGAPVSFKLFLHLLRELLRGVAAELLEEMIAGRDLDEDREVAAERHRHPDERHRDLEDRVGRLVDAEPLVGAALDPGFELDDEIDALHRHHCR